MGMMEDLAREDIIGPLVNGLHSGDFVLKEDGKIYTGPTIGSSDPDLGWLFARMAPDRNCFRWHWVYLNIFHFIPKSCFGCWKIVARPRNLDELMKVYELQQKRNDVGKCGIERRPFCTYKGWYAAFWYCPLGEGLDKARELYKEVKKDLHKYVAHDLPVILKRACTEMEEEFGPSNLWTYHEAWRNAEGLLDDLLVIESKLKFQPKAYHEHMKLYWMRYAFEHGDPTAANYCDKYPESFHVQPTVTYHDNYPKIVDERGVYGSSESKIERL